jgi:uncharacterized protein (TIGR03083 family)
MSDPDVWLGALRRCHDRLAALVGGLDADELRGPSFCTEWTVAQVLSHLGSQAEIFSLFVDAGLAGGNAPSQDAMRPIWDRWNAREPEAQAAESLAANEALISRFESLDAKAIAAFHLDLFGMDLDATGLVRMRLSEYAVHAWDMAVALDPDARVAPDAVELLVDGLPAMAGRVGKPAAHPGTIAVTTEDPVRRFVLTTGGVNLEPVETESVAQRVDGSIELAAEVLLRLVYGRLLESDTMRTQGISAAELQTVFPGV